MKFVLTVICSTLSLLEVILAIHYL